MKISASLNSKDKMGSCQSFKGFPVRSVVLPEVMGDIGRYIGNNIGTPEQKLIVATSAALLRPLIDIGFAEEDKKVDTAIKSTSKAIAGGLTGVTIRALFIHLTNRLIKFRGADYVQKQGKKKTQTQMKKKIVEKANSAVATGVECLKMHGESSEKFKMNFVSRVLLPKSLETLNTDRKIEAAHRLKQYNNSLGGLLAIIVMAFYTNSALDAPLTSDFQDLIGGVVKEKKTPIQSLVDVATNRYKIIKNWTNNKKNNVVSFVKKTKQILDIITNKTE